MEASATDRAGCATLTRRHDLDHTDHIDQGSIFPEMCG